MGLDLGIKDFIITSYGEKLKNEVKVNEYYPSSEVCNRCEYKNEEVNDLSVRKWICPRCGMDHDRDINVSENIMYNINRNEIAKNIRVATIRS